MWIVHQFIGFTLSPYGICLILLTTGIGLFVKGKQREGLRVLIADLVVMVLVGLPLLVNPIARAFESGYPALKAEDTCPDADAIVLLGGGVSGLPPKSAHPYPNIKDGGDRVWHAARLWNEYDKRGKKLKIYCTGPNVSRGTPMLLCDLGVAADCIVPLDDPRNTQEEAELIGKVLGTGKILLVTSALHMKRAETIFHKRAPDLEVVPCATDHMIIDNPDSSWWRLFVPTIDSFGRFNSVFHEVLGMIRYGW